MISFACSLNPLAALLAMLKNPFKIEKIESSKYKGATRDRTRNPYAAQQTTIDELNNNLISSLSPSVQAKQQQMETNWECFMSCQEPHLPNERIWDSDVVRRNVMSFLPRIVSTDIKFSISTYMNPSRCK